MLAFLHEIPLERDNVFSEGDQVLLFCARFRVLQNKSTFAANSPAHFDNAVDLRDLGRIFWTARLEQFGNARQTAGDVFRLGNLSRRLCQQCARANFLVLFDNHVRARWNRIAGQHFFLVADNDDLRMQIFFVLDDDGAHQAGRFIDIALDRNARDHVAEFDLAALVGQNRHVVRVPLHERLAFFHMRAVVLRNHRTDNHVITLELAAFCVVHADGAIFAQDNPAAIERLNRSQIVEAHRAVILRFNDRLFESLARRSADVECPHRQLRSWFAD